jgi:aspartate carbamoyltransferase catalytic subunit
VRWGGKKVVIVGDIYTPSSIIHIYALQIQGAEVKVCGPKTFTPKHIESLGKIPNLRKALNGVMLQICYVYKRTNGLNLFSIY